MGRQGNTDTLNLEAVGVDADKRGLLEVNSFYQVGLRHNDDRNPKRWLTQSTRLCVSIHTTPNKRQTTNPNIYAAGDCIGYPALASTSMEQGRRASCHMWGDMLGIPEQPKVRGRFSVYTTSNVCVCRKRLTRSDLGNAQGEDHGEVVKSVMQKGFLGRDTEQLFPYGIYTYV